MMDEITFADEINQPTINLPRAALRVARSVAYPAIDVDFYMARLDALAETVRPRVSNCKNLSDRVDALADFLFYELEFRGNRSDYYDPRNSCLNCVLDRKLGIPITLSMVFISVAQRLGMLAYGVGLPGHFIAGVYENGTQVLLDPFNSGLRLTAADCDRLVKETTSEDKPFNPKWLNPISSISLLARLLTNLCNAYVQREDWQSAIPVIQHLLMLQPNTDFHLRDLGYLYLYNGSLRLSARYLEEYLRRAPDADDFETVRSSLAIVAGRLALWN